MKATVLPRRVLTVAPSAYPLGGVAQWMEDLHGALDNAGVEVLAALPTGQHHDLMAFARTYPSLHITPVHNRTGSQEGRIRALLRVLQSTEPDVVLVANMPDTYEAINRYRARRSRAVRVALTVHGYDEGLVDDVRRYSLVTDAVISASRLLREVTIRFGHTEASRAVYVPCGTAVPELRHRTSGGDPLTVAWVGRISQQEKRVLDLALLASALDRRGEPFNLLIAGAGPDESALRQSLAQWDARGCIRWMGQVPHASLPDRVWAVTDILVITSDHEAGPLVAWEAMAHGVAVCASRYLGQAHEGALRDMATCVTFPVGDMGSAAEGISALRSDDLRLRLVGAAHQMAGSRYSRERFCVAWLDVLMRMMAQAPRAHVARGLPVVRERGRLDQWLGPSLAETVRSAIRRRHAHVSPGGEWPHASAPVVDQRRFLECVKALEESLLMHDAG